MIKQINTFSKDCQNELGEQLPIIYKNQFSTHNLISVNYNGLLTDLETYWNQEARFREGFEFTDDVIIVPNFFCKLSGVPLEVNKKKSKKSKEKYLEQKLKYLFESKFTKVIKSDKLFDLLDKHQKIYEEVFVKHQITFDDLGINSLCEYEIESLNDLNINKRDLYLKKIIEFFNEIKGKDYSFKAKLLTRLLLPSEDLCILINNFDYAFDIPKLVILNTDFDELEAYSYYFLNYLCFDIVFINPSGKVSIDKYFNINEINYGYFEKVDLFKEKFSISKVVHNVCSDINQKYLRELFMLLLLSLGLHITNIYFQYKPLNIILQFVITFGFGVGILWFLDSTCVQKAEKEFKNTHYFTTKKYIKFFVILTSISFILGCILSFENCMSQIEMEEPVQYTTSGHLNIDNEVSVDKDSGLKVLTDKEFTYDCSKRKLIGYIGIPKQTLISPVDGNIIVNNKTVSTLPTFDSEEYIVEWEIPFDRLGLSATQNKEKTFEITIQFFTKGNQKNILFMNSYPVKIVD